MINMKKKENRYPSSDECQDLQKKTDFNVNVFMQTQMKPKEWDEYSEKKIKQLTKKMEK